MKVGVQKETLLVIIYLTLIYFIRTLWMWFDQIWLAVARQQKQTAPQLSSHFHSTITEC